ncbi:hypothetical protein FNV43_RR14849 [Rhamnella rubrinervis]|uniref:Uncharacterized protein n=1 Tax=Rhamnella rubrinervis TaxID=2594499 RepID=A0A8K0H3K1_9ROSA|nr:hypothetical protein FNV43_RR14849 [Rhamnella rubrinervis]
MWELFPLRPEIHHGGLVCLGFPNFSLEASENKGVIGAFGFARCCGWAVSHWSRRALAGGRLLLGGCLRWLAAEGAGGLAGAQGGAAPEAAQRLWRRALP